MGLSPKRAILGGYYNIAYYQIIKLLNFYLKKVTQSGVNLVHVIT